MLKNLVTGVKATIKRNLTKTDIEAFCWVGFGLSVYFGFISVCWAGNH